MSLYTDIIRQWAVDSRRAGILTDADGTGEVGLAGAESGNQIAARFTLKIELGKVNDIRYQVFGCGYSMAACAVAADMSIGYTLEELDTINAQRINDALNGLPSERMYCAELAAEALHAAVLSAQGDNKPVSASISEKQEQHAQVNSEDPVYRLLKSSYHPRNVTSEDRHLFACLVSVALKEPYTIHGALGLAESDVVTLLRKFFPRISYDELQNYNNKAEQQPPEINEEILALMLEYVPRSLSQHDLPSSVWLCYIIAARAAHSGHLWVSMGLFERPELTASIQRHLPALHSANHQKMRWKRFLFKQVCDRNGGSMCKAPNCGECSDYRICFAGDD